MKNQKPSNYMLFYLEIPKVDHLADIEIQDEYDTPESDNPGLSAEQVSNIAQDSLEFPSHITRASQNQVNAAEPERS